MRTVVSRDLAATGLAGYEPETFACFLAAIEEQDSRAVFDVGANIGVFSWLAASLTDAPVVAFEPTPDLVDQMRAICEANGLSISIEPIALGAEPGRARLYLSENSDSSNSLRAGFRRSRGSVMVAVETIDGYVARSGIVPAVVKVDTESTEPDVLRGAGAVIAEHRPIVLCEVLAGRTEQELTEILQPLDYTWYRIDGPGPLQPRSAIEGDPTYEYKNWLFTPSPASPAFWERMAAWHASIAGLAPPAPAPKLNP